MSPGSYNLSVKNQIFVDNCVYRDCFAFRFKGLLGKNSLEEGEGILLMPCTSIHMFFMRFPVDALFIDSEFKVLALYAPIKPWRISRPHFRAAAVIEVAAGRVEACNLAVGDQIQFEKVK